MGRGPLKVWVNNAGVARSEKGFEDSDADVRLMVETNLLGVMWGSRAAIEQMRSGGGHVINIASLSSLGPVPGLTTYAATKHGVLDLLRRAGERERRKRAAGEP